MENEEVKFSQLIVQLDEIKILFQRYKEMPVYHNKIMKEIRSALGEIPPKVAAHIQELMELDIEAEQYLREDYDPETMLLWERLKKDQSWHGYWKNACGLDTDLYCNYILAAIKYSEARQGRSLSKWFHDNSPTVKPIPYSIKLADEDLEKFLDK